ncbi:MAG TPA: glycosyltransferase family 2 protein [Thermoleophilaceae bacterium]|jgi:GT2 family glycosyltransferase
MRPLPDALTADPAASRPGPAGSALPTFTVVVCAYTSARWPAIEAAIQSVLDQSHPPVEVLLVIDHDDLLLERARRAFTRVRVVPNDGPAGLSGGRNTGVRHARGEVVAFLDDDARADRRWLERLARWYDDPRVVGAGGVVIPEFVDGEPAWLPRELHWIVGGTHTGVPTAVAPVRNSFGSNMSFRREALDEVGGFAPALGRGGVAQMCCEETELSIRVGRARRACTVLHVPGAVVHHAVPSERATWDYLFRRSWIEGRSKALVARSVGMGPGLQSERAYVSRVLPRGVARGLRDALRGDSAGLGRAAAIVASLATTVAGYAYGTVAATRRRRRG